MAEVIGIGSLLADQIIEVSDSFLEMVQGKKGGMEYAALSQLNAWIALSRSTPITTPGGSAANVIRGLAHFGRDCTLITKTGDDLLAKTLKEELQILHVSLIGKPSDQPTGRVLAMVTPDGQRTMRTFLGASAAWDIEELQPDFFRNAKLVHVEGYSLFHPGVTKRAMSLAKKAGALISFDLSSFEVTEMYKLEILSLVSDYVDVLIANEDEAKVLTGRTAQFACSLLKDVCRTAIVTMGPLGCWVGHRGIMHHCKAYPAEPLDSTGAGDLFCSGFLHGFLQNMSPEECAHIGATAAGAVVKVYGTNLSTEQWHKVLAQSKDFKR